MALLDKPTFLVTPTPFADRDLSKLHSTAQLQNPYVVASRKLFAELLLLLLLILLPPSRSSDVPTDSKFSTAFGPFMYLMC